MNESETETGGSYRTCPECENTVVLSERAVARLNDMDIGCAECDLVMWPEGGEAA